MDPELEQLLADLDNRRGEETRFGMTFPGLLKSQKVQVVNLSATGARLVVQGSQKFEDESMPLMLEIGGQELELSCTPKWEEKLSERATVIGVAFPQDQPVVGKLNRLLQAYAP